MKVLSAKEARAWLRQRNWSSRIRPRYQFDKRLPYFFSAPLPADAGRKTALARFVATIFHEIGQSGLWFYETGVFPSCENRFLFEVLRESVGETRPLSAAPLHLFPGGSLNYLEASLDLTLYFFWDGLLLSEKADYGAFFSHDEFFMVGTTVPRRLPKLKRSFHWLLSKQ